ncbi:MAG: hypothetical protein DWQ41_01265 [Planctomycetota bacterium]|nr:MAG: hypothetical protein DWQ41_01265 [Planctomycetota bacterium]
MGWFDNWPAWAVYSARPSVVEITVRDTRVNDLPVSLQAHVGPPPPLQEWRPVNIDAWSFAELDCPVYPQERYRLAVALAIADRAGLGDDMRVVRRGPPDRITGERWSTRLNGRDEIAESCSGFFINTQARRIDYSALQISVGDLSRGFSSSTVQTPLSVCQTAGYQEVAQSAALFERIARRRQVNGDARWQRALRIIRARALFSGWLDHEAGSFPRPSGPVASGGSITDAHSVIVRVNRPDAEFGRRV